MSIQNNKRSARVSSRKVTISNNATELTSQVALIPVVTFPRHSGLIDLARNTIELKRGSNALYDSADALF